MQITEKLLNHYWNKNNPNNLNNSNKEDKENNLEKLILIFMENMGIKKVLIKTKFTNLMFLSLQKNNINDMDFVLALPSLWYLDLRKNSVIKTILKK